MKAAAPVDPPMGWAIVWEESDENAVLARRKDSSLPSKS